MGFPSDFWLPTELCRDWQGINYPAHMTPESIERWLSHMRLACDAATAALGLEFAARLRMRVVADARLIEAHLSRLKAPQKAGVCLQTIRGFLESARTPAPASEAALAPSDGPMAGTTVPNGPYKHGYFGWSGTTWPISDLQWRLLQALWNGGPVEEENVQEAVYGHDAGLADNKLRKLQYDTNMKLMTCKIPFEISRRSAHLELARIPDSN